MDPTLLIVAVVSLAIGFFVNTIFSGRQSSQNTKKDHSFREPVPDPGISTEVKSLVPEIAAATPIIEKKRLDMAAFWREQPSGALRADIDGRTIKTSAELSPEQHRRLEMVIADLRSWLTPSAPPASSTAPEVAQDSAGAVQPLTSRPTPRPIAIPAPPASTAPTAEGKPTEAKSIVSQIDDILQDKLVGTPLEDRRIRLIELSGHGVAVKIGIDQYNAIDDVPDPEIQAIIRAAVKIWEGRAG